MRFDPASFLRLPAITSSSRVLCFIALAAVMLLSGCRVSKVGMEAYNKGDYPRARTYLYEAIRQEPDMAAQVTPYYISATVKVADAFLADGRHQSALTVLDEAREVVRDDRELRLARVRVHVSFAEACLRDNNLDLATTSVQEVRRLDPQNARARELQGAIILRLAERELNSGRFTEAIARYNEYLREFPDDQRVKQMAADACVARGQELARRRAFREAVVSYAAAFTYVAGYRPALIAALQATDQSSGGIAENYMFLVETAPRDATLRAAVVEQLQRRAEDRLELGDSSQAAELLRVGFQLDPQAQQRLAIYERIGRRIVEFHDRRGETTAAIRMLDTLGEAMPPLRSAFTRQAQELRDVEASFFLHLDDDLNFVIALQTDLRVAIDAGNIASGMRGNLTSLLNAVTQQRESLTNAKRTRNRQLLDRRLFRVEPQMLEPLVDIVGPTRTARYRQMIEQLHAGSARSNN